jgi:hypothetical protein
MRLLPTGFVPPCLPTKAQEPPSGPLWWHEIKHDGFRVMARKDGSRVRLYSRPGNDLTDRFRLIVEALVWLRAGSCIIDGEVVICGEDGLPVFDRLRYGRHPQTEAVLFAFDLLELGGKDLRRTPLEDRKRALANLLPKASWALQLNEHIAEAGSRGKSDERGLQAIRSRHGRALATQPRRARCAGRARSSCPKHWRVGCNNRRLGHRAHHQGRPSGDWKDDDFDVLADGVVVGRIFNATASPVGTPWMWTLISPHHQGRSLTHGYEATREASRRPQ